MVQRRARTAILAGFWVSALAASLTCVSNAYAEVTVTMRADRTQISMDEAFTLEIRVEASGVRSPDVQLPPLDAFEVLQRQVSRPMQFSFSFGSRSERVVRSSSIYSFVLRPQMTGRITIQPVKVKVDDRQYQSQPLTIIVGKSSAAPPAGAAPQDPNAPSDQTPEAAQPPDGILDGARFDPQAFIRTIVDKTDPYVGDQVTVSIYLYLRGALTSLPPVEAEPTTDGFWIRDLLPPSRTLEASRQVVGGSIFKVYLLRRFAAFPLHSGNLTIGPLKLRIEQNAMPDIFDLFDMMDRGAAPTLRRSGIPVEIRVKELPEAGKPNLQVAVGRFEVSAKLDRNEVRTGDAVTLKAVVRGQGNIQTIQVDLPKIGGLQILAPQVSDSVESPDSTIGGSRSYEWLVIPQKPGRYVIGPIGVNTFNPATGRYQRVQAEALSLVAAGKGEEWPADKPSAAQPEQASDQPTANASFGPIRTTSEFARSRPRVATAPWYLALLALGPFAWIVLLVTSWSRQTLKARAQKGGPQRAAREAKERLREATACADKGDARRCYAEVTAAIQGVLEARLGMLVSGYTRPQLRDYLASRDMPQPLIAQTIEELERCDAARFSAAGSDKESMKSAVQRVSDLLRQLSVFTPKQIEP